MICGHSEMTGEGIFLIWSHLMPPPLVPKALKSLWFHVIIVPFFRGGFFSSFVAFSEALLPFPVHHCCLTSLPCVTIYDVGGNFSCYTYSIQFTCRQVLLMALCSRVCCGFCDCSCTQLTIVIKCCIRLPFWPFSFCRSSHTDQMGLRRSPPKLLLQSSLSR